MIKRLHYLVLLTVLAATGFGLTACSDDYDDWVPVDVIDRQAIVTIKPNEMGGFIMQLNDNTTLTPVNMGQSPYGDKEVRAMIFFSMPSSVVPMTQAMNYPVTVLQMDSILTKQTVPDMGSGNVTAYGNDPVEIVKSWETCVEDGYLTLRFRTLWGSSAKHRVNLVVSRSNENPYKVTFFHDANGEEGKEWGDALVAFRLKDLPDTNGEYVDLTLEWNSFSGRKSTTFKYKTR